MRALHAALWALGAPVRVLLLGGIALYRITLSEWLGGQCRFSPTCSRYAEEAIRAHGAVKGAALGALRLLRCNPFGRGGLDPVPGRNASYDDTIRLGRRHAG